MNYKILHPEKAGQKYWVVPAYGSGECWKAEKLKHAKQILLFVKNRPLDTRS